MGYRIDRLFEIKISKIYKKYFRCIFSFYREVLALKDGGQIALDWLDPAPGCLSETPVVVILPGLTGNSQAEYIKGLALAVNRAGLRAVIFNNRGIGGIELKVSFKNCF